MIQKLKSWRTLMRQQKPTRLRRPAREAHRKSKTLRRARQNLKKRKSLLKKMSLLENLMLKKLQLLLHLGYPFTYGQRWVIRVLLCLSLSLFARLSVYYVTASVKPHNPSQYMKSVNTSIHSSLTLKSLSVQRKTL